MGAEQSQQSDTSLKRNVVNFFINGKEYNVNTDINKHGPESRLIDYIRDQAGLKGTKYMCREGGCGACVVTVKTKDPNTGEDVVRAVNSCLMPLFSCDGWDISTIESLGSVKTSLHPIQQRMVNFSASQCGYCSPGWIMNMHGLMESKKGLTAKDVEDSMDGNICRCTGYRPIFDAMKSLASDASEELKRKCGDLNSCAGCPCNSKSRDESEIEIAKDATDFESEFVCCTDPIPLHLDLKSGEQWVKATDLNSLFMSLQRFQASGMKYRVVAGNTGTGVYKNDGPYQAYVDVNSIGVMTKNSVNPTSVIIGGAVSITKAIEALKKAAEMEGYEYCKDIAKHWQRVANTPVRNAGTLAGNLMLKHAHSEFPSDIFLLLETVGAMLTIASAPSLQRMYDIQEFLKTNMNGKIILSIHFPKHKGFFFRSFKITRRYQNAHAYVNAGFLMQVDPKRSFMVTSKPSIVFGGINPTFVNHFSKTFISNKEYPVEKLAKRRVLVVQSAATENFLNGKMLDEKTIQSALMELDKELQPDYRPPDADPAYRKTLAQSLLYKFILGILGSTATPKIQSGGPDIERGLIYGKQVYDTDKTKWPLYEPVMKLEAPMQCTGEAEYTNDIHPEFGELFGVFVNTKVANAMLDKVYTTEAMEIPGVVAFVDAKEIPGQNNFMITADQAGPDVVFVQDKITHAGQPVGVIVAESRDIAVQAAKLVKVTYTNVQKPVLDIPTSLAKMEKEGRFDDWVIKVKPASQTNLGSSFRLLKGPEYNLSKLISSELCDTLDDSIRLVESPRKHVGDAPHNLKGEFCVGSQYHFQMEPQVCICVPREEGMDVFVASQWIQQVQSSVAGCLGMPNNAINVQVRRLGGGFGSKLARASHVATACALAANKTKRPVRMVLDLETNMETLGKRLPYVFAYDVGFDDSGKILSLSMKITCDPGCTSNEATAFFAVLCMQNCYTADGWQVVPGQANTNTPPNTYCRAPGTPQAIGCMEYILDHIAFTLKKDSMEIRMINFLKKGDPIFGGQGKVLEEENCIPQLLAEMKTSADLDDRMKFVATFNQNNRWKKRGLALAPMRCPVHYFLSGYNIFLSVYGKDGSVSLAHSGIEMGQGINTKVAQVIAKELGIPLTKIRVKPANMLTGANGTLTGGAVTSEHVCYAAFKACEILNKRMGPVKEKMENPSWEALVAECAKNGLDLTSYYNTTYSDQLKDYAVWGLTACEVEIDCLTGEYKLVRVDLINDAGQSLSPDVDIGQVEGAFIFGLGMWLTEKIQHNADTGELLTIRTWDYKPPASRDIPEDFRVTFMRNASNPNGVLGSKATGEAPLSMSVSALLAIKKAITAAREDAGNMEWFPLHGPVTPEDIHRLCLTSATQFTL